MASIAVNAGGYASMTVTEWEKDAEKPTEHRKRRELFDRYKLEDEENWSNDRSAIQNEYYKTIGTLLEVCE